MNRWLVLGGNFFVMVVSIVSAIRVEEIVMKVFLITSALVSLILAISNIWNSKKMDEKIQKLEDDQLSVSYNEEEETFYLEEGKRE